MRAAQVLLNALYGRATRRGALKRERKRWAKSPEGEIRVYYGLDRLPGAGERSSGGIVKCRHLHGKYPNSPERPGLLYLVSSALPLHSDVMAEACREAGGKVVLNQNGVAYPAWHGPGWRGTNRVLARVHSRSDYVLYQSDFCRRSAVRFLGEPPGASEVLYNAVDTEDFAPPDGKRDGSGPVLLLMGSHNFFHRLTVAVDALREAARRLPNARLIVGGRLCWRGTEEESGREARGYAEERGVLPRITFLGPYSQGEAPAIYRQADLLLHPQYNDCCPSVVLEAMASGLPVVHSATGGTPELVGEEAGVGVPGPEDWERMHPPDPRAVAAAVEDVARRLRPFSAAARERAVRRFDLRSWLRRHGEIFESLSRGANVKPGRGETVRA